jgi:hypothetical protein
MANLFFGVPTLIPCGEYLQKERSVSTTDEYGLANDKGGGTSQPDDRANPQHADNRYSPALPPVKSSGDRCIPPHGLKIVAVRQKN